MQQRGQLTDRIAKKAREFFDYDINQTELRFLVYIQYYITNSHRLDKSTINSGEREILAKWRGLGYMGGTGLEITITKEFWDIICELVFLGYVDIN